MYRLLLIVTICTFQSSCINKLITLGATGAGAGGGALVGGPGGATIGGMLGYAGAELVAQDVEAKDFKETITKEAVNAIVEEGMAEHGSAIDQFKKGIQKILMIVGALLALYLCIPVFVAKYSAERCANGLTKVPFPVKPSDK